MTNVDSEELAAFLAGDLSFASALRAIGHGRLLQISRKVKLGVDRVAVRSVLQAIREDRATRFEASLWASLVRRGYFPQPGDGHVTPISIDVDRHDEEQIMECVDVLDQFGDAIDGEVADATLDRLIAAVS